MNRNLSEKQSFTCRGGSVRTGRGTGGDDGAVETGLGDDVDLDGGVTTGVVDGAGEDLGNGHDGWWNNGCGELLKRLTC